MKFQKKLNKSDLHIQMNKCLVFVSQEKVGNKFSKKCRASTIGNGSQNTDFIRAGAVFDVG